MSDVSDSSTLTTSPHKGIALNLRLRFTIPRIDLESCQSQILWVAHLVPRRKEGLPESRKTVGSKEATITFQHDQQKPHVEGD